MLTVRRSPFGRARQTCVGAALAAALGCGTNEDSDVLQAPRAMAASGQRTAGMLYTSCPGAGCTEGQCVTLPGSFGSRCTTSCETEQDCAAGSEMSSQSYTDLLCVEGYCYATSCAVSEVDHNRLVAPGLLCVRGEIEACDSLSPKPCSCGCSDAEKCDPDTATCTPKLAIGEECGVDDEACASGYCDTSITGGYCKLPPGTPCDSNAECSCRLPEGETEEGYCGGWCVDGCRGNQCGLICLADGFGCNSRTCRRACTGDDHCASWELCEFESADDLVGLCEYRTEQ